jgi:hypothetical protein
MQLNQISLAKIAAIVPSSVGFVALPNSFCRTGGALVRRRIFPKKE